MPDCSYCGASFDGEEAYLAHLEREHEDELGRIDRRRIGEATDDGEGDGRAGFVALAAIVLIAVALVVVVTVLSSDGGSPADGEVEQRPTDLGSAHYHGPIEVVIDGQAVDFSRDRYQRVADAFHFERGDGSRWHVHARGVTLEYAMATLGFDVTGSTVAVDDTTYRDADPDTSVTVTVDGDPITPSEYVLQQGDEIRIVAERSDG